MRKNDKGFAIINTNNSKRDLYKTDYTHIQILKDGNCFFKTISVYLTDSQENYKLIREIIADYEEANRNMHLISQDGNYKLVTDLFKNFIYYKVYNDKLVVFYDNNFKIFDSNLNLIHTQDIGFKMDSDFSIVGNILIYSSNKETYYYDIEKKEYIDSKIEYLSTNDIKVYNEKNIFKIYDKDKYITEGDSINENVVYAGDKYIFILNK